MGALIHRNLSQNYQQYYIEHCAIPRIYRQTSA